MTALIAVALALVALLGTAVVATRPPERQAVTLSMLGLALAVLFATMQAPGVALAQLGIGSSVVPLMVMLATRRIRRDQRGGGRKAGRDEE